MKNLELPRFEGTLLQIARQASFWVDENLVQDKISAKNLLRVGRTPERILNSGRTVFAFGCLEKGALIGAILKAHGIDVHFVRERLVVGGEGIGIHFALEAQSGNEQVTIDVRQKKTTFEKGFRPNKFTNTLSYKFRGESKVEVTREGRFAFPKNPMKIGAYQLAGLKGRTHYLIATKANPLTQIAFINAKKEFEHSRRK